MKTKLLHIRVLTYLVLMSCVKVGLSFSCTYAAVNNNLSTEQAQWLQKLKQTIDSEAAMDFLAKKNPPTGLAVVHAWSASPYLAKDQSVGHMALQLRDYYLSVWPQDNTPHTECKARNIDTLSTDIKAMGPSHFVVLNLPKVDYQKVEDAIGHLICDLDDETYTFSIGTPSLNISGEGFQVNWSPKKGCAHDGIKSLARRTLLDPLPYHVHGPGSRWRGGATQIGMFVSLAVAPPLALVTMADMGINIIVHKTRQDQCYEEPIKLTVQHTPPTPHPSTIHCMKAVMESLTSISALAFIGQSEPVVQKITVPITLSCTKKVSYINQDFKEEPLDILHPEDEKYHTKLKKAIRLTTLDLENESETILTRMAACLVDTQEEGFIELPFTQKLRKIQDVLTDTTQSLKTNVECFRTRFTLNKGYANLLFADPQTLPEGALRTLAHELYHSQQPHQYYAYSSWERIFGKPISNRVRLRNAQSMQCIGKLVQGEWHDALQLIAIEDDSYLMRLHYPKEDIFVNQDHQLVFQNLRQDNLCTSFRFAPCQGALRVFICENYRCLAYHTNDDEITWRSENPSEIAHQKWYIETFVY